MNKEFKAKIENTLIMLYEYWLMGNYPYEIHCKEDLIEASEQGRHQEVFIKEILEVLRGD